MRAAILLIYRTALDTFQILDIFSGKTELYVHEVLDDLLFTFPFTDWSPFFYSVFLLSVHKGRKISCASLTNRELIMLTDIFTEDGQ